MRSRRWRVAAAAAAAVAAARTVAAEPSDGEAQEPPTFQELDEIVERFRAMLSWRDGLDPRLLAEPQWRRLVRCWDLVRERGTEQQLRHRCRMALLFARGVVAGPVEDLGNCDQWAYIATPDRWFLTEPLLARFGDLYFWPPLLRRRGGVIFDVGGGTSFDKGKEHFLPWKPSALHIFEAVPAYAAEIRAALAQEGGPEAVQVHEYGLAGRAHGEATVTLAGSGTSLFHELQFSGHRMYLDSVGDPTYGRLRNATSSVEIRSVVEVWEELGVQQLALLHMNCEGCEYEVIPTLADAGLLQKVEVLHVALHSVLYEEEADVCDRVDGSCGSEALMLAIEKYCHLNAVLSRTHRRVFGVPLQAERWELMPDFLWPRE